MRFILGTFLLIFIINFPLFSAPYETTDSNQKISESAKVLDAVKFDISMPLRIISPKPIVAQSKRGTMIADPGPENVYSRFNKPYEKDIALQKSYQLNRIPAPQSSFKALSNISNVSPPDPTGDVGPNHYVAMTNLSFHVFDKSGVSLYGPAANNTLWTGFGGACEEENSGDPIVLYDQLADRWLLSQFTVAGPEFFNCIALSTTSDPTGSYYRWALSNGSHFPDYPKYSVWSDGYYISTRDFLNNNYVGVGVYALERNEMIAGNPNPTTLYFFVDRVTDKWKIGDGLLPADIEGTDLPPVGSPQYFIGTMDDGGPYEAPTDALSFWEFHADFVTPANSSFTLTNVIDIANYDTIFPCGGSDRSCIPQKDTDNLVDIQSYRQRPLHRLSYRNFGSHEALITNQSVEAAEGLAGIRWWELRNLSTIPSIHQEGTYAPGINDDIHRWMGSIAMDVEGNIGLAYSASSAAMYPAIRYTGRLASDPYDVMPQGEQSIFEGTGSQTSGTNQRWGDYTSLNVDPTDDCTFWHVNQYFEAPNASGSDWQIRVGSFKFDECGVPGFYLRPTVSTASVCTSEDATYDIDVRSIAGYQGQINLTVTGTPANSTIAFSQNPINSLPDNTTLTVGNTINIIPGHYGLEVIGTPNPVADIKTINLALDVFDQIPLNPVLTSPTDGESSVDVLPSLNWTGDNALTYTVEIAGDIDFNQIVFSKTTIGNSMVPDVELDTGSQYYWRVKSENSCGESSYSDTFTFFTVLVPGDCNVGYSQSIIYEYGFESGFQDWTSSSLVGPNTWTVSSSNVQSGTSSMYAQDVGQRSDQLLTSPSITLPIGESPMNLQFWNYQAIEDDTSGCYDGALIEISIDNGITFTQIQNNKLLTDPYDGVIGSDFNNPLSGREAWCGDIQDWLNSIINIDDYAGETVKFRFRLASDSAFGREGWYLDDIKVQSCKIIEDVIFANGFDS